MKELSLIARQNRVLAQNATGTNSRRHTQYPQGYPTHLIRSQDCYVYDIDEHRYVDFVGGLGVTILGYNHPKVTEAVKKQLSTGYITASLPHPIEIQTAELITEMFPGMEKVRFGKNGVDATDAAVRIARSYTKKEWIISEGYHGSTDLWVSLTPPALGVVDTFKITNNIPNSTQRKQLGVAAFITEPVSLDCSESRKTQLQAHIQNCKNEKTIVIFDEIVTGCRMQHLSVAKTWGLDPDMMCLGKAIANGFPLSVVGGKKEIMDHGEYFISKTFACEAISLAACHATLTELKKKNMKDLWYYANRFQQKFNEIGKEIGVEIKGYGTRGAMNLDDYNTALFVQLAAKAGLLFGRAFFYTFSHMESRIEEYVFNMIFDIVHQIKNGAKLDGDIPTSLFKRT